MITRWMDMYHLLGWGNGVWRLDLGEIQKLNLGLKFEVPARHSQGSVKGAS